MGTVLNGYLCLRKLVVQRTKLIDETQDMLLEMLEDMTTGSTARARSPGPASLLGLSQDMILISEFRRAGEGWHTPSCIQGKEERKLLLRGDWLLDIGNSGARLSQFVLYILSL